MNNWLFSCLFLFSFSLSPLLSNEIPERIIKLEKIESILSLESSNGFVWEYSETKLPSHWLKIEIPSNPKNIFHKNTYYLHTFFYISQLPSEDLILHIHSISDRDKIYFNNVLIGSTGVFDS
ncbi:MAG: hypothetical protein EBS19_11705, partial [Spirochaetia bacterium]|nr:hypothetical protein [Spirochaetia bacterium]